MAQKNKKRGKQAPYLTKRILISTARTGVRKASEDTMRVMGYSVVAEDGWVVKKFPDGSIEKIEPLVPVDNVDIRLD